MSTNESHMYNDKAYVAIKDMAVAFTLKPNEQINIVELSEKLNVSQTPVREALNRLFNEKLVVRGATGRGFFGRSIDGQEYQDLVFMRAALVMGGLRRLVHTPTEAFDVLICHWRSFDVADRLNVEISRPLYSNVLEIAGNLEILEAHNCVMNRIFYLWRFIIEKAAMSVRYFALQDRLLDALVRGDIVEVEFVINSTAQYEAGLFSELIKPALEKLYRLSCAQHRRANSRCGGMWSPSKESFHRPLIPTVIGSDRHASILAS